MSVREVESLVQRNVQQSWVSIGYRPDRKMDARSEIRHGRDERHKKIRREKGVRGEGSLSEKSITSPNLRQRVSFDCGYEYHYAGYFRCNFPSKYSTAKHHHSSSERTPYQGQRQQKNVFLQGFSSGHGSKWALCGIVEPCLTSELVLMTLIQFWPSYAHAASEELKLQWLRASLSVYLSSCDFWTANLLPRVWHAL